jgi:hypothetical protein
MAGASHMSSTNSMFWIPLYPVSKLRQILPNQQTGAYLTMR